MYYFDTGIINIFAYRPSLIETIFPEDISFAYESRIELLSRIFTPDNEHILKSIEIEEIKTAFMRQEDVY